MGRAQMLRELAQLADSGLCKGTRCGTCPPARPAPASQPAGALTPPRNPQGLYSRFGAGGNQAREHLATECLVISKQADGCFSFARSGEQLKSALKKHPVSELDGSEDTSVFLDLDVAGRVVVGSTPELRRASIDAQMAFGLVDQLMSCGHYDSPVRTTQELSKIATDLFDTRSTSTGFALVLILRKTEDGRSVLSATDDDIMETASGQLLQAVAAQFYLPPGNSLFPCRGVLQDRDEQGAVLMPPHMRFFVQGNEVNLSAHPWTTAVQKPGCTPSGAITVPLTVGANAGKSVSMRFVAASAEDKERHDQPWGKSPALFFACNDRVLDLKPTTENLSAGLSECEKSKANYPYRGWGQLKELCEGDLAAVRSPKSNINEGSFHKGKTIMKQTDLERYTSAQRRWLMGVGIIAIVRVDHLQLDPTKTRFSQSEEYKEIKHTVFKEMIRWAQKAMPADLPYEVKEEVAALPMPQKGSGAASGGGKKPAILTPTAAPGKAAARKALMLPKAAAAAAVDRKGKRKVSEGDGSSDDNERDGEQPSALTGAAAKKAREMPARGGGAAGSPHSAPLPTAARTGGGATAAAAPPETFPLHTGATTRAAGAAAPTVAASVAPPRAGVAPLDATRAPRARTLEKMVADWMHDIKLAEDKSPQNSALQQLCTELKQKLSQLDVVAKSELSNLQLRDQLSHLQAELKKVRAERAEEVMEMRADCNKKLAAAGFTPEQAAQKVTELEDLRAKLAVAEQERDDAQQKAERYYQQLQHQHR